MSYCRWSSMNWQCDVYVYEDCSGGWTTHMAARRRMFGPIPDLWGNPLSMKIHRWSGCSYNIETKQFTYAKGWKKLVYDAWCKFVAYWHRLHMGILHLIPLRPIGLPHDGESFNDPTPQACAERLIELRKIGYKVPQYAIDALMEETE